MTFDRREVAAGLSAFLVASAVPATGRATTKRKSFPRNFLWGAGGSGHQTEGNNTSSDYWLMENVKPTAFAEHSGDAANGLEMWPVDLDLVKSLGLNSYRFSLEWSRIEPEEGRFSIAALEHYRHIIDGCRARGLKAIVTFNHFSCPRWFAARGGWTNPAAPALFARYCERAATALADGMHLACTLNEPNLPTILSWIGLPGGLYAAHAQMLKAAGAALGVSNFSSGFFLTREEHRPMIPILGAAHRAGRAAIKSVRADLPVGLALAVSDDQAVGTGELRDRKRSEAYVPWFEFADDDDFIGVQNYDRSRYDSKGALPPPVDAPRNYLGTEVYAPSLAGAVRYVFEATRKPIVVTEHGVGTNDDALRAKFVPEALHGLHQAIAEGVPVWGYVHWSLLDNFEWYGGFGPKFGLASVDPKTFARIPKVSARVFGRIARDSAL